MLRLKNQPPFGKSRTFGSDIAPSGDSYSPLFLVLAFLILLHYNSIKNGIGEAVCGLTCHDAYATKKKGSSRCKKRPGLAAHVRCHLHAKWQRKRDLYHKICSTRMRHFKPMRSENYKKLRGLGHTAS